MKPVYQNNRIIDTIAGKNVDKTPVWIMRQAGRYLPEYRKVRQQAKSFMGLCTNPELAAEVTLQPLARYALDAAIIFSDILTIPDALGLELAFEEGKGPFFNHPLDSENKIKKLPPLDCSRLAYVYEAIQLTTKALANRLPLIGFCGSPFTVAAYMVEGRSRPGFPTFMNLIEKNPTLAHQLLAHLSDAIALHLNEQIKAGVGVVMLFDTWGGLLNTERYAQFSLHYIKQIIGRLSRNYNEKKIPVILFTKNGHLWLETMLESTCDVIGVDWQVSLQDARARIGEQVGLQGNLNPSCLLQSPEEIRASVQTVLQSYGKGSGHIFNLGHGITPDVPPEHVAMLVDAVHELSVPFHQ